VFEEEGLMAIRRELYPTGRVSWEIPLDADGRWHGEFIQYYPDGSVEWVIPYVQGKRHGQASQRHPNNRLKLTREYVQGQRQGVERLFQQDGATLTEETHYVEGTKQGRRRCWRPDGTLESDGEYAHDVLHGAFRRVAPDGSVIHTAQYTRGQATARSAHDRR